MKNCSSTAIFKKLQKHSYFMKEITLLELFKNDPKRVDKFSISAGKNSSNYSLFFDFSKNIIDDKGFDFLIKMMSAMNIKNSIEGLFSGEKLNYTENQKVSHCSARNLQNIGELKFGDFDEVKSCRIELKKIREFIGNLNSGKLKASSDKKIYDFVILGIGGSIVATKMVYKALINSKNIVRNLHFMSSVDYEDNTRLLSRLNPENTMFLVVSKSFKTKEVLMNFDFCKRWLSKFNIINIKSHFIKISSSGNRHLDEEFSHKFSFPKSIGGRFSVWSSVGILPLAFVFGFDKMVEFLEGGEECDRHFLETPFEKNIPVIMGGLSVWYRNFLGYSANAILPYKKNLIYFPEHLKQLCMESNGKFSENIVSSGIVFGGVGTDFQHSFGQLLHQGNIKVWSDFIIVSQNSDNIEEKDSEFFNNSNALAQSESLMTGLTNNIDLSRNFEGNRPSTTIILNGLSPFNLGFLLATYEHKVFVEGLLYGINSFDQFGVELAKIVSEDIFESLKLGTDISKKYSNSTKILMEKLAQ